MTKPDAGLAERTARAMGWELDQHTYSGAWRWRDTASKRLTEYGVDNPWAPEHDANQAMMLWDDMVKRGLPVTLQEAPGEPTACYYGSKFIEAPTKNEAICLAFLRAEEAD